MTSLRGSSPARADSSWTIATPAAARRRSACRWSAAVARWTARRAAQPQQCVRHRRGGTDRAGGGRRRRALRRAPRRSDHRQQHLGDQRERGRDPLPPREWETPFRIPSRPAGTRVAGAHARAWLGVTGPAHVISSACASSAKALASAARLLQLGVVDAVVTGGVDTIGAFTLAGFDSLQLVSATAAIRFRRIATASISARPPRSSS